MKYTFYVLLVVFVIVPGLFGIVMTDSDSEADDAVKSAVEPADAERIRHGQYLTVIAGCNDCHTPGYALSEGKVPVSEWLTGDRLGWQGPWGTTYPINLRLFMNGLTEDQWVHVARNTKSRPPMPWYALRDMTDSDLVDIYRFIKHLGPAGEPAPAYLPPGEEPQPPFVSFNE